MQRILAISWLTWKAALRFKLFLVIAVLLILAVVGLPLVIKDDGTAQGFTQIILTYTLSVGARHRGMPDPDRRHKTHRTLANLDRKMAGHRDVERGTARDFRRVCLRLAAMACDKIAGSGTENFA